MRPERATGLNVHRFSSRSFKNIKLYTALDQTNNHNKSSQKCLNLAHSRQVEAKPQHNILSAATDEYLSRNLRRTLSSSFRSKVSSRIKTESSCKNMGNPELPSVNASNYSKGLTIGERCKQGLDEKVFLQSRIQTLKALIHQERKQKDKAAIKVNKLRNQIENCEKQNRNLGQRSKRNNITIELLDSEGREFESELGSRQRQNVRVRGRMEQQEEILEEMRGYCHLYKCMLEVETQKLGHLKHGQSVASKSLSNLTLLLKQKKEDKTVFQSHLRLDILRHQ